MARTPDEYHDVILHDCKGTWQIWVGEELHGLRYTLASGLARAREVAVALRKPAWLADASGCPLTPIEPDTASATARLPKKVTQLAKATPESVSQRQQKTS